MAIEELIAKCREYQSQPVYGATLALVMELLSRRINELEQRLAALESSQPTPEQRQAIADAELASVDHLQPQEACDMLPKKTTPATGTLRELVERWRKNAQKKSENPKSTGDVGRGESMRICADELAAVLDALEPGSIC